MKRPTIIAHRGVSAHAPENTLAAFRMAMESQAGGVEFDVRLAKDGVPVVIHDRDLKRTGKRIEKVSELTSKELSKVDVGSWFDQRYRKRARPEFENEAVPTLEQTLSLLKDFNGPIYIELKANASTFLDLSAAVCNVIRDSALLPHIIIKSFKLASIPEVKYLLPGVQTAALFAVDVMLIIRHREHIVTLASEFGADRISVHHSLVSPKLARAAAEVGMPITVWTVDDPRWLSRRRNLNIDALITNDPDRFLNAI
jgi:glycerophosphoryl diester phosphodiesterase